MTGQLFSKYLSNTETNHSIQCLHRCVFHCISSHFSSEYVRRYEMPWIRGFILLCLALATHSKKHRNFNRPHSVIRDGNHSKAFQREILSLMGLPKRPRPPLRIRLYGKQLSAPRFMYDLYKSLSKNDSDEKGFCCNSTLTDQRAAGADTIVSFPNHSK